MKIVSGRCTILKLSLLFVKKKSLARLQKIFSVLFRDLTHVIVAVTEIVILLNRLKVLGTKRRKKEINQEKKIKRER